MDSITVRELAEELQLSKTSIHKRIDKLGLRNKLRREGNKIIIPLEVADQIRLVSDMAAESEARVKQEHQPEEKSDSELVEILKAQLAEQSELIKSLQAEKMELYKIVQQNNHLLMAATVPQQEQLVEAEQAEIREDPEKSEEKKGFFSRLFGR